MPIHPNQLVYFLLILCFPTIVQPQAQQSCQPLNPEHGIISNKENSAKLKIYTRTSDGKPNSKLTIELAMISYETIDPSICCHTDHCKTAFSNDFYQSIGSKTPDDSGSVLFSLLLPGTYRVKIWQPDNTSPTQTYTWVILKHGNYIRDIIIDTQNPTPSQVKLPK